jgi:hypothetical protein
MKIVILSTADSSGWYAATLMERGHEISIFGGGAIFPKMMEPFADYDGCLLLGTLPEYVEIADIFESMGKKVWHQLADIPREQSHGEP